MKCRQVGSVDCNVAGQWYFDDAEREHRAAPSPG